MCPAQRGLSCREKVLTFCRIIKPYCSAEGEASFVGTLQSILGETVRAINEGNQLEVFSSKIMLKVFNCPQC